MKKILVSGNTQLLVMVKGEEFIEVLTSFCEKEKIQAGSINALGACGLLTLAWYDLQTKAYEDHVYKEDMEIASITGNVSLVKNKPFIHAHGVFGKRDMNTIGGHIRKMIVSATCEVKLDVYDGKIQRKYDKETGLNLMCPII